VPARAHRLSDPAHPSDSAGEFPINFAEISAMTIRAA